MEKQKKLSLIAFVLMILTSVFGVVNIGIGFFRMGYAAIPIFIVAGILFFIPFILMMIEFGSGFKKEKGGIFSWMQKSVNTKFAFIGIMMWYASYVVWMFGKSFSIWVPLSFMLFGKDITIIPLYINNGTTDLGPFLLGIVGIILIIAISYLITKGTSKLAKVAAIGGFAVIGLNVVLLLGGIIVFFINGMQLQEPLTLNALLVSPNQEYQTLLSYFGFVVFAVFAFGGVEALAGVADDLKNPHRDLKRGILIAGLFTIICYVFGFLMVGSIMAWSDFDAQKIGSLQSLFIIMYNLGFTIGGDVLGQVLMKFTGFAIFLSYMGAMIALGYAPLKQLIGGTPKEFWPEKYQSENEQGIKVHAVKFQAIIVSVFIGSKAIFSLISPEGASKLYDLIITMTNVGMTIPYLFLIIAWYKYKQNDQLEKDLVFFKSKLSIIAVTISTLFLVAFGNIFTIIEPLFSQKYSIFIWTIIGPIIFSILALVILYRAKNKV